MKSILVVLGLVFSSALFAARLPTVAESNMIDSLIQKPVSVKPIIDLIISSKVNPLYQRNVNLPAGIEATPGKSRFVKDLMERFNLDSPMGSEVENLQLLKLLIDSGLDLNKAESGLTLATSGDYILMEIAANQCANSAIELMVSRGAIVKSTYWLNTFEKSYLYDSGSVNDQKCSKLASHFLDLIPSMDIAMARSLMGGNDSRRNDFLRGVKLDQGLNDEIKLKLKDKFGIILSAQPTSTEPSDEWLKDFAEHFSIPTRGDNDLHGPNYWELWWPQYTSEEKAWACYYSTFDEIYLLLKNLGYTDEQLSTTDVLNPGGMFKLPFGEFAVKTFAPYCDSIR